MVGSSTPTREASRVCDGGVFSLAVRAIAIQLAWLMPRCLRRRSIAMRQARELPCRAAEKRSSIEDIIFGG
jgi:hypothetical protein